MFCINEVSRYTVVSNCISTRDDKCQSIWLLFLLQYIALMYSDSQVGGTALMWAASSGECDVVTELISLGADVDIQTNVSHFLSHHDTGKMVQDHRM